MQADPRGRRPAATDAAIILDVVLNGPGFRLGRRKHSPIRRFTT